MFKKLLVSAAALLGSSTGVAAEAPENTLETPPRVFTDAEWPVIIWHPSGYIKLGVLDEGNLNFNPTTGWPVIRSVSGETAVGLRYLDQDNVFGGSSAANPTEYEATSQGCECEGWGAAFELVGGGGGDGQSNNAIGGIQNLVAEMLHSDASCMGGKSKTTCSYAETNGVIDGCLRVQHKYHPSTKSDFAYKVEVIITNECAAPISKLQYRRTMDWDIDPNPFNERVRNNPGNAVDLVCLHDNGFCPSNPTDTCDMYAGCAPAGGGEFDAGTDDHGANFDFTFADITDATPLGIGASKVFNTFYGAHHTAAGAREQLGLLGVEAYSLGSNGPSPEAMTHFFGFSGVGGDAALPTPGPVAPCDCAAVTVTSETNEISLRFADDGTADVCL